MYLENNKTYITEGGNRVKVTKTRFKGFLAFESEEGIYYTINGITNNPNNNIVSEYTKITDIDYLERIIWSLVVAIVLVLTFM